MVRPDQDVPRTLPDLGPGTTVALYRTDGTEQVFGLGGLGRTSVQAVTNSDEPVIIAVVLLAAVFVVIANIVVDLLYAGAGPPDPPVVRPAWSNALLHSVSPH